MIQIDVDIDVQDRIGAKAKRGVEKFLLDGAQAGQNMAMEHVPEDRSNLRMSMAQFVPEVRGNEVVWGSTAPHTLPIEKGTQPFWPPAKPLVEWANRIGMDDSFGYYVQWKIAQEGIESQPFLEPGAEAQAAWYSRKNVNDYIDNELK